MGEPREDNIAIVKAGISAGYNHRSVSGKQANLTSSEPEILQTFDFPYKRSALLLNPRDVFFKSDRLYL